MKLKSLQKLLTASAVCLSVASLAACDIHETSVHGYIPDDDLIQSLEPGRQNRRQVARLLGTPSTIGTFESKYWYYINKTVERVAMLEPTVLEQNVLVVEFNDEDRVENIYTYVLEDGQFVDPVTRQTPTRGAELNILQQLLGNVGRFNPN